MTALPPASDRLTFGQRIRQFFYADETPFGLALTRMILPLPLIATMFHRWTRARELFSADGATTPLWVSYGRPNVLPELPGTLAVICISVLIVALATLAIGWCTRASAALSFTLYTYLTCLDTISTMTKYSVIASHLLLLLTLSQCGSVWSVDAWLKRRREGKHRLPVPGNATPRFPAWPRRLMQLMIGYVYFGAAITKLHTPAYFSSDQLLAWFTSNVNNSNPVGEYLTMYPAMLVLFAYIAVVWEILFLFLSWRGMSRLLMLVIGVAFHVMTTLTLGLYIFPVVCIAAYFAFLNEDDIRAIALIWRRFTRRSRGVSRNDRRAGAITRWIDRSPVPSPMAYVILLAAVAMVAVEVEYRMDPYGKRRPEGRHTLKELDTEFVETVMMAGPKTIRAKDMVWGLKAGTVVVGGHIFNPRRRFRAGEMMTVQFVVNPPHPDFPVECSLEDADGNVVLSKQEAILRETKRPLIAFPIPASMEPGRYSLVLKRSRVTIQRHKIEIVAANGRLSTN